MKDVNSVTLVCRLTKDPELRSLPSGSSVCAMRVAFSTSWKNQASGEWEDRPNYCDVTVWGKQGESCAQHLAKGRQIAVLGRLQWREWEAQDGTKRQALDIVAETVQFLGSRNESDGSSHATGGGSARSGGGPAPSADDFDSVPVTTGGGADDDIPF